MVTIDLTGPEGDVYNLAGVANMWNHLLRNHRPNLLDAAKDRFPYVKYNDVLDLFDDWFQYSQEYRFLNDPRVPVRV